jgi:uncharacterized membrane protein YbhN (UPF0104 family)
VKVVAIADSEKRRAALADATGVMLADKAIDVVTLLVLALVLGPELVARMARGALHSGWAIPLVIAGLVGAIFALRAVWPAGFEKLKAGASATWRATRSLFTPTRLTAALALGFGAWFAEVVILMVLCSALGSHLSFSQSVIALFVLNLGIAVPISVANVGAYEAATVMGLGQFGVGVPEALAIGTLHHAIQIASVVLVAGAFWLHDRVKRARAPR